MKSSRTSLVLLVEKTVVGSLKALRIRLNLRVREDKTNWKTHQRQHWVQRLCWMKSSQISLVLLAENAGNSRVREDKSNWNTLNHSLWHVTIVILKKFPKKFRNLNFGEIRICSNSGIFRGMPKCCLPPTTSH